MIPRPLRKSRLREKKQHLGTKRRSLHRQKRKQLRPRSRNQQGRKFFRQPFGALLKKNISNRQKFQGLEKMAAEQKVTCWPPRSRKKRRRIAIDKRSLARNDLSGQKCRRSG